MKQKLLNKFWLRVGMIVAVMTTALAGTVKAEEVTFDFPNAHGVNSASEKTNTWTTDYCTIVQAKGTSTSDPGGYLTEPRWYKNHEITFTPATGYTITKIVLTGTSGYTGQTMTASAGTVTTSTSTWVTTWTGSITNDTPLVLTMGSQFRPGSVVITYSTGGSSAVATTTTIDATGITNTDVYADTDAGSLSASVTETESGDAVSGAIVSWESSDEDVATIDEDGNVTLVSAGTVTFTATYAGVSGSYIGSSNTYEMTVTSSAPYVQPTTIEITPNYTFWGQTSQFSGSTYSSLSGSQDNVTLTWSRGNGSTYANTTAMRFYKDNTLTFTAPTGYEIKSIELTMSQEQTDFTFSPTGYDTESKTWTGSAESVTMTRPSNASSYAQITKFTITIGLPSTDPSISADDVNIGYDETSGSIAYTLENATGNVSASVTTGDWLTLGTITASEVPFTCEANTGAERTATVTLSFSGATDKVVTISQAGAPVIYTTIPDLFEAATGTATEAKVTFNNWVVSGVSTNGKNVFVTDNAGNGFVIFNNAGGLDQVYEVGNILSGTAVSCNLVLYNGFAELTGLDVNDLTITTGGSVTVSNIALADLAGVNTGALVSYENLTCSVNNSKYYLTDGTTTLQVFNSLFAFDALEAGKVYNITGVYQQFNSTKEILPRSADDIEEVEAPVQTTVTAGTLSHVEISSLYDGDMEDITLGDNVAVGTLVYFSLNVTEGYTLESVTVLDASNNEVTLTENQGSWSFTMPNSSVTINATATASSVTPKTLTNANIVAAGTGASGYQTWTITDSNGKIWNAYAVKNQHSNATSAYHYLQIKKYASNTASYLQVPEYGTKITSITMTVSGASKPMDGGSNTATLYFSDSNSTVAAGEGVVSGTGASEVTIDCSSLNLNTGYITASGAVRIWDVTVVYEEEATRTLNAQGYATFASTSAVNFDDTEITAWAVTAVSGSTITFAQVTGDIAPNTGLLLKGAVGATISPETVASGNTPAGNLLVGITEETYVMNEEYFGLKGAKFVKVAAGNVPAGRALLPAEYVTGTGVKTLTFNFDEDATAIKAIDNGQLTTDGVIYNVAGQRLNKMQKGINIVNGKKILK